MTIFDLFFLASVLFVCICLIAIIVSALRLRRTSLLKWTKLLTGYLTLYAVALIAVSLLSPRRVYAPGERRCWDDWCTTAIRASAVDASATQPCPSVAGTRLWIAEIELSSVAKRVRQSAPDARAELEDEHGKHYSPCAGALPSGAAPAHALSDFLNPGDSFSVFLPFLLPTDRRPAGIVTHHGDFVGVVVIAEDSSFLHPRALQRVAMSPQD